MSLWICCCLNWHQWILYEQQLKDHTEPDHPDYNNICQALEKVIQINNYLNEKQREFEDRSKLIEAAFELVGTHAEVRKNNFSNNFSLVKLWLLVNMNVSCSCCALQEIVRPHRILIYSCKIELLLNNNSNNNTNTNNNNNNELIIPGKFYLFNDMIIVGKAVTYKGEIKYQILHLIILKKNHNLKQDKGTKNFAYSIHKILWCFILIDLWISSSRQYSPNHNKWWWGCLLSLCTKRLWRDYQKARKFVENTK
jgi:hypothetical protein